MVQRIFASVKASLERLGTDYIDVFQVGPARAESIRTYDHVPIVVKS